MPDRETARRAVAASNPTLAPPTTEGEVRAVLDALADDRDPAEELTLWRCYLELVPCLFAYQGGPEDLCDPRSE